MDETKLTRLEEFKWNAVNLPEIQRKKVRTEICSLPWFLFQKEKGKEFEASEDETFKEWFFENVVSSEKFLEDIEYGFGEISNDRHLILFSEKSITMSGRW